MTIDSDLKQLATGKNFAVLATLSANGHPRTHMMWVDADDEHLIINTEVDRAKFRDLQRDPRVTVTVFESGNPYRYIEARGEVVDTVTGPDARAHIDACAKRYTDADEYQGTIQSDRVMVKIRPDKIHKWGF